MSGKRVMPGADRRNLHHVASDGKMCIFDPENEEDAWIQSDLYMNLANE